MNLELAHRLSLIQRQIEHAQLMLESAAELFNVVMAEVSVDAPQIQPGMQSGMDAAMPVTKRTTAQAGKPSKTIMGGSAAVREFIKTHTGDFRVPEVLTWARQHGITVNKKTIKSAVYGLSNIGKELTTTGRGTGIYRKVAEKAA